MFSPCQFFMHAGIQRKYVSKSSRVPGATSSGESSLLVFCIMQFVH